MENKKVGFNMVLHYRTHRFVLGVIAIIFPLFLLSFSGAEKSISAYYWTNSGTLFTAALVSIGIFLLTYRGYDIHDNWISGIAGAMIIGVALFPTLSDTGSTHYLVYFIPAKITGILHYVFAGMAFFSLGVMSLFQFSKCNDSTRSAIFQAIGFAIFVMMITMIPVKIFLRDSVLFFWQEVLIVWLFGTSWILKGLK